MKYKECYQKYQQALKMRDLSCDENFQCLNTIFNKKILDSLNINTQSHFIPYLAGIKEVFNYVEAETELVNFYKEELDKLISEPQETPQ